MMSTWTAHVQIDGSERSWFTDYDFEVSDTQMNEIQEAIEDNIAIKDLGCYDQLIEQAASAVDYHRYIDDWDAPDEEDYDSPEEYEKDLEDYYNSEAACLTLARIDIDDPGDMERLNREFIGRELSEDVGLDFYEKGTDRIVMYTVWLYSEEGKISKISIDAQAMEYDDVHGGSSARCYPDYEQIKIIIREELEQD